MLRKRDDGLYIINGELKRHHFTGFNFMIMSYDFEVVNCKNKFLSLTITKMDGGLVLWMKTILRRHHLATLKKYIKAAVISILIYENVYIFMAFLKLIN